MALTVPIDTPFCVAFKDLNEDKTATWSTELTGHVQSNLIDFNSIRILIAATEDSGTAALDITLEDSVDGVLWEKIMTATQLTVSGESNFELTHRDTPGSGFTRLFGPRVRILYTITGSGQWDATVFVIFTKRPSAIGQTN